MLNTHIPISYPDKIWVNLPALDIANEPEQGKLLGFSSYKNQVLTSTILLNSGAIFYDIPLHCLSKVEGAWPSTNFSKYCPFNCPDQKMVAFLQVPFLSKVSIFNIEKHWELYGRYLLTIDWPEHNWLVHIVEGLHFFYALPNFQVLFNSSKTLPKYNKLKKTFTF